MKDIAALCARRSASNAARRHRLMERDALSPTATIAGASIAVAVLAAGVSSGSWLLSGFAGLIAAGVVVSIRNRLAVGRRSYE